MDKKKVIYVKLVDGTGFHTITDRAMSDLSRDLNEYDFVSLGEEEIISTSRVEKISFERHI